MRTKREFYKDSFWHIFNRGVDKNNIFRERDDFSFYVYKIKEFLKKYPVEINAYNLLDNHVHCLINQTSDIAPSKFIGGVHTSFGIHINRKYSRVGHLFQDRFKAKDIKKGDLLFLSFYVNLNKVLEKIERLNDQNISEKELDNFLEEAEKDPWNSYAVYLGKREDGITKPEPILRLISDDINKAKQEYPKLAKEFLISGHFLKTRGLNFKKE